ncbi:receptor protein-tyrosine kinase CEPR1-like [Andrographis paniculata]|uniref:receptor protein-tyrosine kinase CEPR1-like n=1 Tax=Andrographis paniculata TaxID=175694 RepID=UPI0021E7398F|nr:receptor protein-tyrosine kinase CEPR1-like [Andrographis paniculata]
MIPSIIPFIYLFLAFSFAIASMIFLVPSLFAFLKSSTPRIMPAKIALSFVFLVLVSVSCHGVSDNREFRFFTAVAKKSLSGNSLARWDSGRWESYCNFTGVSCNDQDRVVGIDVSGWSLTGKFPDDICSYLPQLRILRAGNNRFAGNFPVGILSCSFLEELNMSSAGFNGPLPDFSPWRAIKVLDLSYNKFSGDFPMSVANLTSLEMLFFNENENEKLNFWEMPENISGLVKLETMVLTSCKLRGEIPRSVGNMTALVDLELSGNYLTGRIPVELGRLRNLQQLELYYNQLNGEIPDELGNLTELRDLDMSENNFSGRIPASICRLPKLEVLQAYNSGLAGPIPGVIANSTTLNTLSLYGNFLSGEIPQDLGKSSVFVVLELSENNLTGRLPEGLCRRGKLKYLLALKNMLSGELPESYVECKSLIRFRVSNNNLSGKLPDGILSLPHASIIDVAYNQFTGSIDRSIKDARNLSELFLQGNRISGVIPPEISLATGLVKIDLSFNLLSGPIPPEIGGLKWLNLLLLQGNRLNSSIPESLSSLASLNLLDLSNNRLTGDVPDALSKLLPNSMNFSNNQLSGAIPASFIKGGLLESFSGNPGLCVHSYRGLSRATEFAVCSQSYNRKKVNCIWLIIVSVAITVVGSILFVRLRFSRGKEVMDNEDTLSSSSYDVKSFHRLTFDQREIIEAMVDKNVVGYGGSGTVYRIELSSGEVVAVKKLWSSSRKAKTYPLMSDHDNQTLDKELATEVETLGSIRHKNIVKLYCYFSNVDFSLLVYEYMPNGNLWDALHTGKLVLDWPTRHRIALGVAQGLAYLHNDLMPPIIHRDIKSTNILLDIDYHPKVADFGIAKVLQARGTKESTTTVIAGTYGYLDPEYAYSSKATTKCDVYSFGVVLMELVTGKKPVEAEFGENKNIIYWISTKVATKEGAMEVLDERISGPYKEEMIKVLCIAIRCTCRAAVLRPTMNEVVQLLVEADPCRCCKAAAAAKEPQTGAK